MTKIPSWFIEWKDNEFHSLVKEVHTLAGSISFVKGQLVVMIPLSIAILGMVIFLALK